VEIISSVGFVVAYDDTQLYSTYIGGISVTTLSLPVIPWRRSGAAGHDAPGGHSGGELLLVHRAPEGRRRRLRLRAQDRGRAAGCNLDRSACC
jgi:hypothetical protein